MNENKEKPKKEKIDGQLVPTLRQGIDIIKMVLFKEIRP